MCQWKSLAVCKRMFLGWQTWWKPGKSIEAVCKGIDRWALGHQQEEEIGTLATSTSNISTFKVWVLVHLIFILDFLASLWAVKLLLDTITFLNINTHLNYSVTQACNFNEIWLGENNPTLHFCGAFLPIALDSLITWASAHPFESGKGFKGIIFFSYSTEM